MTAEREGQLATWRRLLDEAEQLLGRGEVDAALQRIATARLRATAPPGEDASEFAVALGELGLRLKRGGDYDQAERCYADSIAILRQSGLDEARFLAVVLNNLAELDRTRGRYAPAEALYEEALRLWRTLGPE